MRGRAIAVTTSAALLALVGAAGTPASAAPDDNAARAEEQFQTYLATSTTHVPLDVSCAPLDIATPGGVLYCYALVDDRQTIAAMAFPDPSGAFVFIPITKAASDPGAAPGADAAAAADAAVLDLIGRAVAADSRLPAMLMQASPDIASVVQVSFFEPTATIEVIVATSAADAAVRDAVAFSTTAVLSGLWAADRPLRDPSASIRPRLEVTVDGTLYSSAFEMMTSIADGTMTYAEWIATTAGTSFRATTRSVDPRADVKSRR